MIELLKNKQVKAIEDLALTFVGNFEAKLLEIAESGFGEARVEIERDNKDLPIFISETFIKCVRLLLDGVSVDLEEKSFRPFLSLDAEAKHYKYTLVFKWGDAK